MNKQNKNTFHKLFPTGCADINGDFWTISENHQKWSHDTISLVQNDKQNPMTVPHFPKNASKRNT